MKHTDALRRPSSWSTSNKMGEFLARVNSVAEFCGTGPKSPRRVWLIIVGAVT